MLIPLSWLKEYVDIKLPLKELMWKMTEAGLTCEATKKVGDEVVLDVEVTANRPDWMSILGVAREIAAIQGLRVREPKIKELPAQTAKFPIDLVPNFDLFERWSAIAIKGIEIKASPKWLSERIKQMGHTPINNVIDITNYVMYELGIPMHAFDYDEMSGQIMTPGLSKGGEKFTSVDGDSYTLPKDAIIINDSERLIDLAGIKGGLNSGIKDSTKNILLHVTIDNPVLVRRASIALGLRSDASAIYERGPDKGGVVNALKRAVNLILDIAGGVIASEMIDIKKEKFEPWELALSFKKLDDVLGIRIDPSEVIKILSKLNLSPKKSKDGVTCLIPTYRGDIKIEEDLVEEVARIYGYNKFPKTLPKGQVTSIKIPYYFDDSFHKKIKQIMTASGYSEAIPLSLLSKASLEKFGINSKNAVKITNPVSLEYEYMRPSLLPGLLEGIKINNEGLVQLFEIDKTYPEENYKLAAVAKGLTFRQLKGTVDLIFGRLGSEDFEIEFETDKDYFHPSKSGTIKIGREKVGEFGELTPILLSKLEIKDTVLCFEFDVAALQKHAKIKDYKDLAANPSQVEDLTLIFPPKTRIGEVAKVIEETPLVQDCDLTGTYKGSYTFRIWYQDSKKNLTDKEVEESRNKILKEIKNKFGGKLKS